MTVRAEDVFCTTTRRPFCKDTRQCWYNTFQPSGKSPSTVRTVRARKSTMKFYPAPLSYTLLQFSITSNEIRTLPEIHGRNYTMIDTPSLYLKEGVTNTGGSRSTLISRSFPDGGRGIDKLRAQLLTPQRSYDFELLLQLRQNHCCGKVYPIGTLL